MVVALAGTTAVALVVVAIASGQGGASYPQESAGWTLSAGDSSASESDSSASESDSSASASDSSTQASGPSTQARGGVAKPPPGDEPPQSPSPGSAEWVSTQQLVQERKALPCTGLDDPINFEVFSAGPMVAGLPMTDVARRCDAAAPVDEAPANRITYFYGDCEIAEGATGCAPPLQIQTWPACQRNMAGYSFEGKPLPSRELPSSGGAKVVEFIFALESRTEVYTDSSTIVIFADDPEITRQAVELLIPQQTGQPPATSRAGLAEAAPQRLDAPRIGATEGVLKCES